MSDERIRVLLVDDHAVVRQGLRSYLESFGDIVIAGSAASGEEAVGLLETCLPDVAVVDLLMPGGMDGFAMIRQVRGRSPHTQVVVLSGYSDDARCWPCCAQGPSATCARRPSRRCCWPRCGLRRAGNPRSTRRWRAR